MNALMEGPTQETYFVPGPTIMKIKKLPVVAWLGRLLLRGYPTLQSQGNQAKVVYFPIKYEGISVFVSISILILGTRMKSNNPIGKFSLFNLLSLI